jgi:N-acetylmuramoyl-L-alanine amidase
MSLLARTRICLAVALIAMLAACGGSTPSALPSASASAPGTSPTSVPTPGVGEVVPAPGSDSAVYAPNPGAVVVAIDPGHGGCLDWGVPNPWDNTVEKAEKSDTLAISLALRDLLEAQGITVVMTRTDDSALAGDDYPDLGCNGPAWRDVDGDGESGFEETGRTRTRDELQARIDFANVSRAALLLSVHINSITENDVPYEIAVTESFYDDETPWGESGSGELGRSVQAGVVDALAAITDYERQDRGTEAVAYYLISRPWQDGDTCETPGDTWCKPHRGTQQPATLSEVGSMSLPAESELLATVEGRMAVAEGLYEGLRRWLGARQLAVRYDALVPGGEAGSLGDPRPGDGPPYWVPEIPASAAADDVLPVRLTNTGTTGWPSDLELRIGWTPSDLPYLARAPASLAAADIAVPALAPGESVVLQLPVDLPTGARSVAWITLAGSTGDFADLGSPPLQVSWSP